MIMSHHFPMLWAGNPSRTLHLLQSVIAPEGLATAACGIRGRSIEKVAPPTGVSLTTCPRCRTILGV